MKDMDFIFEQSHWEKVLSQIPEGAEMSAVRFLTLLEGEEEAEVEAALSALEQRGILLDVQELPADSGSGSTAVRLRQEQQFVKKGMPLMELEENDPLRLYLEELSQMPAAGDPAVLAQKAAGGDDGAMSALAGVMMHLVIELAGMYTGYGVLLTDLIQEGSLGLWQGILSYTEGDVEAYCHRYIRQYLAKAVTLQARASGVGQKMRQALEDYRDVDRKLLDELGRNPTLAEIAEQLHITPEAAQVVEQMLKNARTVEQAHASAEEKEPTAEDEQAVEDTAYFQSRQRIMELLSSLSEEDAKLLTLRFGLEGGLPMDPEQTGKKLGLTPQEVVARETAALAMLRQQK